MGHSPQAGTARALAPTVSPDQAILAVLQTVVFRVIGSETAHGLSGSEDALRVAAPSFASQSAVGHCLCKPSDMFGELRIPASFKDAGQGTPPVEHCPTGLE